VSYYAITPSQTSLPDFSQLTPYKKSMVSTIYYAVSSGEFLDSGRSDYVGAVFTGTLDIPADGAWTFYLASDDGSKLYMPTNADPIGLVIDNDGLHGTIEKSATVTLSKGPQAVLVEFFEEAGAWSLMLSWSGPGTSREPVPATAWLP
jgi:hypothetical protein